MSDDELTMAKFIQAALSIAEVHGGMRLLDEPVRVLDTEENVFLDINILSYDKRNGWLIQAKVAK